jgi:hypothetical protein
MKNKNYITKYLILVLPLLFINLNAQDQVDPLEAARLAKSAAEKAQAEADAATEAAIQSAATKAATQARENAVQAKKDAEAKKIADAKAAENAELDALAKAAGDEAKRKIAQELGLDDGSSEEEVEVAEEADEVEVEVAEEADEVEEFVVKESSGFNLGFTSSIGFVNGALITNTPAGGSLVINTPYGFNLGGLGINISLVLGSYTGEAIIEGNEEPLGAFLYGLGVNATLFQVLFSESHIGIIGAGPGVRNFSGVSLERIMKGGLNLPVNILVGGEGFITTKAFDDPPGDLATYWGGLGVRVDYSF